MVGAANSLREGCGFDFRGWDLPVQYLLVLPVSEFIHECEWMFVPLWPCAKLVTCPGCHHAEGDPELRKKWVWK